nr:hypothetical protein [Tanacetum cinerariifolium]
MGGLFLPRDDVLFSPDNEEKVFNPRILSHEKSVKIITRFTPEKKLAVSFASCMGDEHLDTISATESGEFNKSCVENLVPNPSESEDESECDVVQIVLWYLDAGCSKHMTGDRSQLINFVHKFLGTVKYGNDHVAKIMGYVLEVAFRQHTCFIRNLDGVDLLTGSRGNNLYTLSLQDMMASSLICLLSKASKTKSWLLHCRLSHLNFGAINHLARQGLVRGLHKLKFEKDHLCSTCEMGKITKKSHKPKSEDTNQEKLYLLHMDLCGPMRTESVNRKKFYYPVSKDDSSAAKGLGPSYLTDNETEFVNQTLREYYEEVGITHETSVARSPQQNDVVV